ncbi:transglutaminase-like domain-containing protein [Ulvibacterium marinum]|uniref:Transglutaminase domain-containing protein n=1 Tax=Ulvibacterium marinum TaxID=2419782 RepID=A0A3B0C3F1_9FLAO|nr:transglutaminase-like domain-containing protein [Ulvibacterium marinum]RKN80252.1 transglutaminase domain-containing protein [Ulvibacterium marinum]
MRSSSIKSFFLLSLFVTSVQGIAQNISIENRVEDIIIKKDTSFVKHVSVVIKESEQEVLYPIFYDNELEKISDIQVYSKKGKRFKPVKDKVIIEDDVELEYIASKKVKTIIIPPGSKSKISYTVDCDELMYFSDLRFFSYNKVDTLKYKLQVPDTFQFVHNAIYEESLEYVSMDSISMDSTTKWNIEVVPERIEPDPLAFFGIYRNKKSPLMRTIVVPASYKDNATKYLNDWYLQKVQAKRGLSPKVIHKINELTKGKSEPSDILDILYNYVKNNFKYVAIEIGMGAFIPTHANEVFSQKEGDCKDLSNFLSEALNYKGINSHIALAATYDHISDCDFPSLSSANHVVCMAYLNDIPIILDPTDPIHSPKTPVQSIQNRSILIVNPSGGEWHKAQGFTPRQNLIDYNIELKEGSDKILVGGFQVSYNGISGNFLRRGFIHLDEKKTNASIEKHFTSVFGNQSIEDFSISPQTNMVDAKGKLSINGKIFNDSGSRVLFLDFLPIPLETQERGELLEGTHLGSNLSKRVHLKIEMNKVFEAFKPIEHIFSDERVSLKLKITNPSDFIIWVEYEFECDYNLVNKENSKAINKILTSFKNVINDPIILKKKG